MNTEPVHLISLGAGVQSSTMALMAAHGEIEPMPKAAIFSDTQAEPTSVYEWLDWLETQLPFPVHRVTAGNLETDSTTLTPRKADGQEYLRTVLPYYTVNRRDDSHGMIPHRKCTVDYKIKPITKAARKLGGIKRGQKTVGVIQWIGISTDEITRMKEGRYEWSKHRWPLIEKRMSRHLCMEWMKSKGYPEPPRSACYFCPFHSNAEWRRLQMEEPEYFVKAVEFEKRVQELRGDSRETDSIPYLHRSRKPLDTIDFRSDVERGQQLLPGWQDECEGMCGI